MELPKNYDSKESEKKWQEYWEKNNIYKFDKNSKKPIYSIDTPPPYASAGHLHVGHGLHYTQFEIIARYRRMNGFNVYFAPGFDNNGLPTEKYVEEKYNISKAKTTKAEFRKLCRKESAKVERLYADKVFKALGHSYDWNLLYTTINPESQKVAQKSFIDLVKQGDAYRTEEPTLWCTNHQTALAQAEIEDLTRSTKLSYVYFKLKDSNEKITIATTRPEFLPACVGIFVHPNDKRYKKLVGKKAIVPLFEQEVKIMKDEKVDPEFGSGIVMICTFGDTTDIEWWKKHKLDLKICITKEGKLNGLAKEYEGLTIEEGKNRIREELDAKGLLIKQENLEQNVGSCWRCNTPIEFIVTKQWFIKALDYKKELIKQARKINWYPGFYRKRFEDWTNNLAWDWCISRQRFYGVPIPVWYCKKCGKVLLPEEKQLPVDPEQDKPLKKCSCGSEFIPDNDVFDTWMTSSMSPEIAIRWLEEPKEFKKRFPMSLRPQAQDIIRTWAFYTILKAYLHFKDIPWKDIALGTFVLDPKGRGMSKSKGNVVWVDDLLERYDVDTFRYWVGTASWGSDLPFQEKDLVAGKKFLTKLWNASKFALMHLEDYKGKKPKLEVIDRWLLTKINAVIKVSTENFDNYNTSESKKITELFFWHTFCDNYLEIIKDRMYNPDKRGEKARESAQYALYYSLDILLKLLAPIIPHITEEIYSLYFAKKEKKKSIHISDWPKFDKRLEDKKAEKMGDNAVAIIAAVRKYKSSKNISLGAEIKELVIDTKENLKDVMDDIKATVKAEKISKGKGNIKVNDKIKIKIS